MTTNQSSTAVSINYEFLFKLVKKNFENILYFYIEDKAKKKDS